MRARLDAVDLARFLALAGMMLTHLGPPWRADAGPPLADVLAGGRASTLFCLLAGVSIALVSQRRPRTSGSARALGIRSICLFVIGLALGSLDGMGIYVVLAYYAVLFAVLIPFRSLPAFVLLSVGGAWAVVAPTVSFVLRRTFDWTGDGTQATWSDLADPPGMLLELFVTGAYPMGVWLAYGLIGLAIGKLDLGAARLGAVLSAIGIVLVFITFSIASVGSSWRELFASGYGNVGTEDWSNLLVLGQHTTTPVNVVSAIGSSLLVVGLCILAMRSPSLVAGTWPLRAAGAMTLTIYVLHVLIFYLMDQYGVTFTTSHYLEWFVHLALLAGFAAVWRMVFDRGPLEQLVHSVATRGLSVERSR